MQASAQENREASGTARPGRRRSRLWLLLLLIPLAGLLYPPFYSSIQPELGGVPFFIWYQFFWVAGGVITTLVVSRIYG